jgi:pimeloyl-ACP methyl ester carboxylesterase
MATFVVAHGAWSAGWAWKKMRPPMRAAGHDFWTPTYTGLGERAHLANPDVSLDTHIEDILAVLEAEDLRDVYLIGHSYGGMVATGVADRARERIAQLVYLDAFVPHDGQSLFDLQSTETRTRMRELARTDGEGWRLPPTQMPADTPDADVAWASGRRRPQPSKTFEQHLRLAGNGAPPPRSYIYCQRCAPGDVFRQFANAPSAKAAGAISRSTPAIIRTSPHRTHCWNYSRRSYRRPRSRLHPTWAIQMPIFGYSEVGAPERPLRELRDSIGIRAKLARKTMARERRTWISASSGSARWASIWPAGWSRPAIG